MSNVMKLVMLVAAAVITLLVIMYAFGYFNTSKSLGDEAQEGIVEMGTMLNESKFTDIEGQTIKGSRVQSLMKTFAEEDVSIAVITNAGGPFYFNYASSFNATTTTGEVDFSVGKIAANSGNNYSNNNAVAKKTNACYVNPSGDFLVSLVRNSNGVIVGVVFAQQ